MSSYIGQQEPCHVDAKHGDLCEPATCATCGLSYDKKIYQYACEDCGKKLEFVSEKKKNEYIQCDSCSNKEKYPVKNIYDEPVTPPTCETCKIAMVPHGSDAEGLEIYMGYHCPKCKSWNSICLSPSPKNEEQRKIWLKGRETGD